MYEDLKEFLRDLEIDTPVYYKDIEGDIEILRGTDGLSYQEAYDALAKSLTMLDYVVFQVSRGIKPRLAKRSFLRHGPRLFPLAALRTEFL